MDDIARPSGKTTVAPDVLVTIAQLNTLTIAGVSRLSPMPVCVDKLFKRGISADGVRIVVENNTVYTDLYVVLNGDVNVREVSRAIQHQVSRAITEMVGMEVGRVNVHIEDIDFKKETTNKPE